MSYIVDPQITNPASINQASIEDFTWPFDCSALLVAPQAPTAVTVTLIQKNGDRVTLADEPSVVGNIVNQRIGAAVLTPSLSPYLVTVAFTPSGTTNVLTMRTKIACTF